MAHTSDTENDDGKRVTMETLVKVKGSLMNIGIESFFSTIVTAKRVTLKQLKDYDTDLLDITPRETKLKYKNVFQTLQTVDTMNERMRSSDAMWSEEETFIDNNAQIVLDRLVEYYKD